MRALARALAGCRAACRPLIENKDKVVLAPASSAYKHALQVCGWVRASVCVCAKLTWAARRGGGLRAAAALA